MTQDTRPTRTIIRRWKKTGDLIAIFPDVVAVFATKNEPERYQTYMHIGQHGACSWPGIKEATRPVLVRPNEPTKKGGSPVFNQYALLSELENVGYLPKLGRYVFKDGRFQKWDEVKR